MPRFISMIFGVYLSAWSWLAQADCFHAAATRYNIPVVLLQAIAEQESAGRANAWHRNADGSEDMGLMQINSRWLPVLRRYGIEKQDLWSPCTNVMVGAWILAQNFARMGYHAQALGAYNARTPSKQQAYARQVLQRVARLQSQQGETPW